uniref:Uncharacterized protein n=1 Tax=Picea sitchensis TaxID=3332 RepID=A9NNM0_PICSI|nr:unknown [Picea sitchensis]
MYWNIYINESDRGAVTRAPVADPIGFPAVECLFERWVCFRMVIKVSFLIV